MEDYKVIGLLDWLASSSGIQAKLNWDWESGHQIQPYQKCLGECSVSALIFSLVGFLRFSSSPFSSEQRTIHSDHGELYLAILKRALS